MLGAIAGDIIGSIYEAAPIKTKDFPLFGPGVRFTDDTVCTVAIADALMQGGDFAGTLRAYVRRYPVRGYGGMFRRWAMTPKMPAYGSWGNGAAMRVSPIAWWARDEEELSRLAARTAAVSHDHPDAIAGAQAIALAMWLARAGSKRPEIRAIIQRRFGYDLQPTIDQIRAWYRFDVSCKGTVPPAIVCALEAEDYEDAVRNAISLGGDSDTLACITGGIAEILYGLPDEIASEARALLDAPLRAVVDRFYARARGDA
ncbi:MAG TPA: ADP-ribosylglycohydrolase family protein [Geminicoccaceae bacterium]|nr:ADP-ribosylglycohydrolase family protein [Geminicoccaceae bacterium]